MFLCSHSAFAHDIKITETKVDQKIQRKILQHQGLAHSLNNAIYEKALSGQPDNSVTPLLQKRKQTMLLLLKLDPEAFLQSTFESGKRSAVETISKGLIESNVNVTGKIEVIHHDDFEHPENSTFSYFIKTGNERLTLVPTEAVYFQSGDTVEISGVKMDETLVARASDIKRTSAARPPSSTGNQRMLVMLLNFPGAPPVPAPAEKIHEIIFDGQFQKYYKEQSYDVVSFTGDVMGWYQFSCETPDVPTGHNNTANLIASQGIDLSNYDRLVFALNDNQNRPCSSMAGNGTVGKVDSDVHGTHYNISISWVSLTSLSLEQRIGGPFSESQPFPWTYFDTVMAHEVGHNLGVMHANGWDCDEHVISGECTHWEYGNYFDVMGIDASGTHFNAFYKDLLGWLQPAQSLTITNSGTYSLLPLNSNDKTFGPRFAKIQILGTTLRPYYLELRKGLGFDSKLKDPRVTSNQEGLFVNNVIYPQGGYPFPRILDMQPTNLWWGEDFVKTTLNVGMPAFIDQGSGITIGPVTSVSDSSIMFDVKVVPPICERREPFLYAHSFPVAIGASDYVFTSFINLDSFICGRSKFNVTTDIPDSWLPEVIPPEDVTLPADSTQQGNKSIGFSVPLDTKPGDYSFIFRITNITSGLSRTEDVHISVIPRPIIENVLPVSGPAGSEVVLTGSGLNTIGYSYISFSNDKYYTYIPVESGNERSLTFNIPTEVSDSNCSDFGGCLQPTPPGKYNILIYTAGTHSNTVTFIVDESKEKGQKLSFSPRRIVAGALSAAETILTKIGEFFGWVEPVPVEKVYEWPTVN